MRVLVAEFPLLFPLSACSFTEPGTVHIVLPIFPDPRNELCTFVLFDSAPLKVERFRGSALPSSVYYLKQAQIAARLALVEPDPVKAQALNLLALDYFYKAEKAKVEQARKAG